MEWNWIICFLATIQAFPGIICKAPTRHRIKTSLPVVLTPRDNRDDTDIVETKIVGGRDANLEKYTYQVYFIEDGYFFCGGSILDSMTILTAAHCFEEGLNNGYVHQVVAGDYNYNQFDGTEQIRNLTKLAIHPDYNPRDFMSADIAVLKLATPLNFNDHVGRPVTLPSRMKERIAIRKGDCWLTGRGLSEQYPNVFPNTLQELRGTFRGYYKCANYARRRFWETWNKDFICTIKSGKASCSGDSGGPITCFLGNKPLQMGVVSWGASNCANGFSAFTRTTRFKRWVMQQLRHL